MPDPDDPVALSLNTLPKYVVSNTLTEADAMWNPTIILTGDINATITKLKQQPGREVQIPGSTTLGRSLLSAGLIDEVRLVIAPVIVGAGRRLFGTDDHATGLSLVDARTTPGGLVLQTYAVDGPPSFDGYDPNIHTYPDHD
jgi:dihydrofolate reductase